MIAPTPLNFPDAMLVPVDAAAVSRFVEGLDLCSEGIGEVRPDWSSDLVWLSPADERHFKLFEQTFLGRRARPLLGRLLGNAATRLPRLARAVKSLLG